MEIEELEQKFNDHIHSGSDTKKINYGDLVGETDSPIFKQIDFEEVSGEDLSKGNAVIIGTGEDHAGPSNLLDDGVQAISNTRWGGQTFLTDALAKFIKTITVKIYNATGATRTYTASIRATAAGVPTGADINAETKTATLADMTIDVVTFIFTNPIPVSAATTYALIIRSDATIDPNQWLRMKDAEPYADGTYVYSTDSGANWSTDTDDLYFSVTFLYSLSGKLYKTNATAASELCNKFIGFVTDNVVDGAKGKVITTGIDGNQSGLTVGSTYYLSDTAGAIASSAGSTSRKVGVALTATQILIKHENQ